MDAQSLPAVDSKRVWTTLLTNTSYLTGALTLDYSLKKHKSRYPLVVLYTDTFSAEGLDELRIRGIPTKRVKYLLPNVHKDYTNDPRFYDCWTKLTPFSLAEYDRVVQLDSDMLVLQNMDELMEIELDPPSMAGKGNRVFAAGHACVCNPLKKPHYPKDWVPENCAFTSQHATPDDAQIHGASLGGSLGMPNGGLQVVNPSKETYEMIEAQLAKNDIASYEFADQSLLGDVFRGRWVSLPYVYNALKTMRVQGVHDKIWRDDRVKNIHYILSPKPWDEKPGEESQESHSWWWKYNLERLEAEASRQYNAVAAPTETREEQLRPRTPYELVGDTVKETASGRTVMDELAATVRTH
ncbi:glycosyltransferase family 8 protein [Sporormia fimetaria CBS 119925]|uniref:Glycosyltransferase family 8 protein n=1 Tax=Sporormia fimetaria CBS 119925 TaxID=1340428 RepID=A0A6A6VHK6_9PLEO|nr:glycosyltransferase family 8 protein [Sporormia fimetaria CBS 119925]